MSQELKIPSGSPTIILPSAWRSQAVSTLRKPLPMPRQRASPPAWSTRARV